MEVEVSVVGPAHAVVYPGAVVVVAIDALVADVAVPTHGQSDHLAERTKTLRVKCLQQSHEADIAALLDERTFGVPHERENYQVRY